MGGLILKKGVVPVLQTPFNKDHSIDFPSLERLIEDAITAGATAFLAPAVASEVEYLSSKERQLLVGFIAKTIRGRVPFIAGASAESANHCHQFAEQAVEAGADACLIAIPERLYGSTEDISPFLLRAVTDIPLPLIVQDLQWNGPGLSLNGILRLRQALPTLIGLKIETVPSGPKYTAVRQELGESFYIAGGWAVPQMIEALDRGVDAMMPQASMLRLDVAVLQLHAGGQRYQALELFRKLLPILSFANQEITTSIAFFKALLVRRGIFAGETIRRPGFHWDIWNRRIAEELIDLYLTLEREVRFRITSPEAEKTA
jgi:dihydrodipicolinate synthase/N-acetylneuraminate lyase